MGCCAYSEFYENEGLMPPVHECPAPTPIDDDDPTAPLTPLELDLARSLDLAFGRAIGKVIDLRGWS